MKVPFIHGPNDLRLHEIDLPRPGPRDVVLRVASAGICGSDLGCVAQGGIIGPTDQPIPLGHELSGTVIEAGNEVASVAVGDRVTLNPLIRRIGIGGAEGGFAERLLVRDVADRPDSLLRLPGALSFDTGALIEPLAVAVHAINRLGPKPGDKVALFGAGPVGLAAIIVLRHRGIEDTVVFEESRFRRDRARQLGARHVIDPRKQAPEKTLIALHGATEFFSIAVPQTTHFLETSGAPVIPEIVRYARARATICMASVQYQPATFDLVQMMAKELTLLGAHGYPTELSETIEMLEENSIDLEPMVSHRFKGSDFMTAFEVAKRADLSAKVLVQYES